MRTAVFITTMLMTAFIVGHAARGASSDAPAAGASLAISFEKMDWHGLLVARNPSLAKRYTDLLGFDGGRAGRLLVRAGAPHGKMLAPELWTVSLPSGAARRVASVPGATVVGAVSDPGSANVAFLTLSRGASGYDLWIVGDGGKDPPRKVASYAREPAWRRSPARLTYWQHDDDPGARTDRYAWVPMALDTSKPGVTSHRLVEGRVYREPGTVSPDGKFVAGVDREDRYLVITNLITKKETTLRSDIEVSQWSPDSSILWVRIRDVGAIFGRSSNVLIGVVSGTTESPDDRIDRALGGKPTDWAWQVAGWIPGGTHRLLLRAAKTLPPDPDVHIFDAPNPVGPPRWFSYDPATGATRDLTGLPGALNPPLQWTRFSTDGRSAIVMDMVTATLYTRR
jgi:hypothetical protein